MHTLRDFIENACSEHNEFFFAFHRNRSLFDNLTIKQGPSCTNYYSCSKELKESKGRYWLAAEALFLLKREKWSSGSFVTKTTNKNWKCSSGLVIKDKYCFERMLSLSLSKIFIQRMKMGHIITKKYKFYVAKNVFNKLL